MCEIKHNTVAGATVDGDQDPTRAASRSRRTTTPRRSCSTTPWSRAPAACRRSTTRRSAELMPPSFQLVARTGHPSFLDLPWDAPLEEWDSPRIVKLIRGISRHVVRFVEYDGVLYALKELPERPARREWTLLPRARGPGAAGRRGGRASSPGRGDDLDAVLITRHLEYSLPYRALFSGAAIPDLRDASAERARRAARAPAPRAGSSGATARSRTRSSAATPARSPPTSSTRRRASCTDALSDGQRGYDLEIAQDEHRRRAARRRRRGRAARGPRPGRDRRGDRRAATRRCGRADARGDVRPDERFRLDERLHRLNELGFDVEEIQLDATTERATGCGSTRSVVEPGHHRHRLLAADGARRAGEPGAADAERHRALPRGARAGARSGRCRESVVASRWREEVFEPTVAAVPRSCGRRCRRPRCSTRCSSTAGSSRSARARTSGIEEAVRSYVERELPSRRARARRPGRPGAGLDEVSRVACVAAPTRVDCASLRRMFAM